jgi:uncharacterized membrane protein YbhN (UPF0104 family)
MTRESRMNALKVLPGLLVSAFFLWWTYIRRGANGKRGFNAAEFHGLHMAAPAWVLGVLLFGVLGYTIRCYRWWWMLRSVRARFSVCARVLMVSLAANNILPLRIGDVMRIFTYAPELNATPSTVLSTVILEKLLDVFTLAALFVLTMRGLHPVAHGLRVGAEVGLAISAAGLLVLVFGAHTLRGPLQRMFAKTQRGVFKKIEHWLLLAMECIEKIGVGGTLLLFVFSFAAWTCEGLMYLSMARLLGLITDLAGPWQAMTQANLSFLIPSSPGGIGPFEFACRDALVRQGASAVAAGLFGLVVHAWLLLAITAVGGVLFFLHRAQKVFTRPLAEELETLPAELP